MHPLTEARMEGSTLHRGSHPQRRRPRCESPEVIQCHGQRIHQQEPVSQHEVPPLRCSMMPSNATHHLYMDMLKDTPYGMSRSKDSLMTQ